MKRTALAAAVVAVAAFASPAAYAAPSPTGLGCGLAAVSGPQAPGFFTAAVVGGPLALSDDTDDTLILSSSGSITCTIQVNASTHAGADACSVGGPETPVVAVAAGTCAFFADRGDNVYHCTQAEVNGTTLYRNDSNDPLVTGNWSTDPNSSCQLATSANVTRCELLLNECHIVDSIVCPILAAVFYPDGDIPWVWDCPPYEDPYRSGGLETQVLVVVPTVYF